MLLRSGRATFFTGPRRRSGGFTDQAAGRLSLKRKCSVEADLHRQVRRKSPPASPCRQPPVTLPPPEVGEQVPLLSSVTSVSRSQEEVTNNRDDSSDETSVAELGVKLFPHLPRDDAADMWVGFVNNAKTCLNHYNRKNQANLVYKRARGNGFFLVTEQDGSDYYHLSFLAQDKNEHSQLFFGEIKVCVAPKEEDVTCCCPVSPSDPGGRSIPTVEEALKHVYPHWEKVGMDYEHCYACLPRFKHPRGNSYVAGHFADTRQYYGFF
ncbi:hypothetical protein C2845_PM11G14740 [Panicum miliaceum]|uniref:DUF3615 domain-containing protein n=1 Tax=Panicum miliaceum TaxID=4540 RepID=A0A3L6RUU4_PANMI|nr:hypothetical protein C2845_PM11G14740 [Panicum miliaceum]